MTTIRIGTRRSQLAMWQANYVRGALCNVHPDLDVEIVGITTQGDRTLDVPLATEGGKGLFLKELEQALLTGDIDLAVHSMKDVTVSLPPGLHIPVIFCVKTRTMHWCRINLPIFQSCPKALLWARVACVDSAC